MTCNFPAIDNDRAAAIEVWTVGASGEETTVGTTSVCSIIARITYHIMADDEMKRY